MPRYTFSPEDRRKGGKTTSQRYDMRERGSRGLKALADRYFGGSLKKAGKALSTMGNVVSDPTRNFAFSSIYDLPQELLSKFWGHCEDGSSDGVPF